MSIPTSRLSNAPRSAPMPPALRDKLTAATRRIRALLLLRFLSGALCVTSVACLLAVGLSKLRLFETPTPWTLATVIGIGLLVGIALASLRPLRALDVARLTERRADLKERLSSAVEFQSQHAPGSEAFYAAQLTDAEQHAADLNIRALYPARLPRELVIGLVATLALFLLFYLPTLPAFWSKQRREEMAEVKKQGIQIEKLAKDTTKTADQQKLDETKKAAAEAQKLGEAMSKGEMNKKQALVAMQKLTRKMEEAQKRLAASAPPKSLQQAQQEFKRSLDQMQREVAAAQQKRAEQARQAAKNPQAKNDKNGSKEANKSDLKNEPKPKESEAMQQARKALEQMQQALQQQDPQAMQQAMQQMAQQMQSGQMSQQEMQQMAQRMNQIAKQMGKGMSNMQAQLDAQMLAQLAQALKDGRLTMSMGKGMRMGMERGKGQGKGIGSKGAGKGWGGSGDPTQAMKDPGNKAKARLLAEGKSDGKPGTGKNGSAQEFAKYLAQQAKRGKYLPNAKVAGTRSKNGQELQQNLTGDPEAFKSRSPYYQAYETNRRAAENALNKENIPAAYKKQVRDYFDSIKP